MDVRAPHRASRWPQRRSPSWKLNPPLLCILSLPTFPLGSFDLVLTNSPLPVFPHRSLCTFASHIDIDISQAFEPSLLLASKTNFRFTLLCNAFTLQRKVTLTDYSRTNDQKKKKKKKFLGREVGCSIFSVLWTRVLLVSQHRQNLCFEGWISSRPPGHTVVLLSQSLGQSLLCVCLGTSSYSRAPQHQ